MGTSTPTRKASDGSEKLDARAAARHGEMATRARALSLELATSITPGFDALAFKASRGVEDDYSEICANGSGSPKFPVTRTEIA